ncbi:MAG: HAD family hydrolase [Ruminococcaceae bacterium]|nr:HAD family hydrolase [Oscillospiraceae bacterium]
MSIKAVLFDLDGTLLPMDQETFIKAYFGGICRRMAPFGYEPEKMVQGIWLGTAAMVKNTGEQNNEAVFWDTFAVHMGEGIRDYIGEFDAFYREDFPRVQASCGYDERAAKVVRRVKERGFRVVLATNPIFPSMATEHRISWAGLRPSDFELYTTYENSCHCKPNPAYYMDILEKTGLSPEECVMVGNDVGEDMIAQNLGMKVFLLTDCLINKKEVDISAYPHGGFDELLEFIEML